MHFYVNSRKNSACRFVIDKSSVKGICISASMKYTVRSTLILGLFSLEKRR